MTIEEQLKDIKIWINCAKQGDSPFDKIVPPKKVQDTVDEWLRI